jgi:hypothetical protein
MELIRSRFSTVVGLPITHDRSAPALPVSGPAQRSLRYSLHARGVAIATLYIEGFNGFVTSTAASIATGWSEPVPGRDLHPLKSSAFHGALFHQLRILQSKSVEKRASR